MAVVALIILGICIGVGGAGFMLYKGLARSDFFQITALRIEGCRRLSKQQILEWSGIDIRSNLLALNIGRVRSKLESHAWVDKAIIERQWPNRLLITVRERRPEALVNLATGLHYVDDQGVIFAPVRPPEDMDFPVISGVARSDAAQPVDVERLNLALTFIGEAGSGNAILPRQNISQVLVTDKGDLILFLADRPVPIYLGQEQLRTKYSRLARVLHWLYTHKRFESITSIRMDYQEDKVLVTSNDAADKDSD